MSLTFTIYPDGSFTGGFYCGGSRKQRLDRVSPHQAPVSLPPDRAGAFALWQKIYKEFGMMYREPGFQFRDGAGNQYEVVQAYSDGVTILGQWCDGGRLRIIRIGEHIQEILLAPGAHPLGLSAVPILKKNQDPKELRSQKGGKGISSRGKKMVKCGCHELEQMYGKDNLSFLTVTLPDLSQEDLQKCNEQWQYLTHRLFMYLRGQCEKNGIPYEYVAATEVQQKRAEYRGEHALHLHVVYRGRAGRRCAWVTSPRRIRRAWARAISDVVGHREFADSALENLQRVRKSASRYLSKYLSKGVCDCSDRTGSSPPNFPGLHWYSMARGISRRILEKIVKVTETAGTPSATQTLALLHTLSVSGLAVLHKFFIGGNGGARDRAYVPIGYAGYIRGDVYPYTRDKISSVLAECEI